MEKTTTTDTKVQENLSLTNRKVLKMDGVSEIISSSETGLYIKLSNTSLSITGQNMHITKLDVNSGILEVEGLIDSIKYGKSANIFKRLFKWKFPTFCNSKTS